MSPFGIAICVIVVLVGIGMYFTGFVMGVEWFMNKFQRCCEGITGRKTDDTSREVEPDK